jgi:hypothetical protein
LNWLLYALVTAVASASHTFAFISLVAFTVIFWFLPGRKKNRKQLYWFLAIQLVELVFIFIMIRTVRSSTGLSTFGFPDLLYTTYEIAAIPFVLFFSRLGLGFTYNEGMADISVLEIAMLVAAAAILALFVLLVRRYRPVVSRKRAAIALAAFTLILIFGPLLAHELVRGASDVTRFYIWATPFLLLLIGWGLALLPRKPMAIILSLVMAVFLLPLFYQLVLMKPIELETMAETVNSEKQDGDLALCFPIHHCVVAFDFFVTDPPPIRGGWIFREDPDEAYILDDDREWRGSNECRTTVGSKDCELTIDIPAYSGASLDKRMDSLLGDAKRIWLFSYNGLYDYAAYPEATIIEDYLDRHGWQVVEEWQKKGSVRLLRLYERPSSEGS